MYSFKTRTLIRTDSCWTYINVLMHFHVNSGRGRVSKCADSRLFTGSAVNTLSYSFSLFLSFSLSLVHTNSFFCTFLSDFFSLTVCLQLSSFFARLTGGSETGANKRNQDKKKNVDGSGKKEKKEKKEWRKKKKKESKRQSAPRVKGIRTARGSDLTYRAFAWSQKSEWKIVNYPRRTRSRWSSRDNEAITETVVRIIVTALFK